MDGQDRSPVDVQALAAAAEAGDGDAQYEYARLHQEGTEGIPRDLAAARRWYSRAAGQGHVGAMLSLSTLLLGSDLEEALRLVLRAAELGSAEAQWRAGQVLSGRLQLPFSGIRTDRAAAVGWFQRGAEQGHAPSSEALADLYTEPDDGEHYGEAVDLYRRAAESGDNAWAVLRLGMSHAIGEGVEASDSAAVDWLSRLGRDLELDPDRFSNEDLDVLGGLQSYYGLDFTGGEAAPDPGTAAESFRAGLEAAQAPLGRPFIHPSFARTARRLLDRIER